VVVDYGPVEIGGRTYICPLESTSISTAEALIFHQYMFYADKTGKRTNDPRNELKKDEGVDLPTVTAINNAVFGSYHQFRGDVRILPADEGESGVDVPSAPPKPGPDAPGAAPAGQGTRPQE